MPNLWRKYLFGVAALLFAGAFIGWLYGHADWGLLGAALLALAWQIRQLLAFDNALRSGDFEDFRHGEGIWQQIFSRFIHETERAAKHKDRHRQLLREIRKSTNAMPDGAVILDGNNEIVTCNRAAKHLVGLKPRKDRGQRVDNLLREPALTKLLLSGDPAQSVDINSPLRDGEWLNCRIVPYGADQKLLLLRDITDRIQLNRMRRDFVANASHELRSPLTVVSGYLDSLADDPAIPEDWQKPLLQMQLQARRMNNIVGELVELSRLESAGPAATDRDVDVSELVEKVRETLGGRLGQAAIEVGIESPARLRGEASQIESVISNLVANALRHTEEDGAVTITWRDAKGGAELIVEDTGEGIPAEFIPRLTERFFRVDRGRARTDGGVGLGLAIVKHILGRHDAELNIASESDVGSRFTCRFPVSRVIAAPPVAPVRESSAGGR